ncbi:hypothetical protein JQ633_12595 [Bradyrhizobium tropiciagri]|uniref:hypothetical protein n=1 Tax=Bradyrhizobium tropiciagri TaxID=312253 RepID=UPI001BA65C04|nr:hypothetical protein [Bradyrhizobium tropiciagri]MBR0871202.1 hypothetical protein [Bradyrhizobium tropiciagri]
MPETITIPLKKPLQSPSGEVSQIVLREPTFDEYLIHGDPYTIAASFAGGNPFMVENPEVIAVYIKVCLVEPKDPAILSQGKARLAKQVKEAVLDFFRPDVETGEVSAT